MTDEEREKLMTVWDVRALVAAESAVLVSLRGTFVRRLTPAEARELAKRFWDVADEVEGFSEARTEPSPPSKGSLDL